MSLPRPARLARSSTALPKRDIHGISLCSTVPSVLREMREMCERYTETWKPVIVEPGKTVSRCGPTTQGSRQRPDHELARRGVPLRRPAIVVISHLDKL